MRVVHGRMTAAPGQPPWFRRRPGLAVAVAVALFAGVLALRLSTNHPDDDVSLLYCLPIALLGITLGLRGGLVGGVVGIALVAVWTGVSEVTLDTLGWSARAMPMLLLGGLLGHASDRLTAAEDERRRFESAAQRHREAVEINDSIVQGLAAAKWSLEAGRIERGLDVINQTLGSAQAMVSDLLRDAEMQPGGRNAPALGLASPLNEGVPDDAGTDGREASG